MDGFRILLIIFYSIISIIIIGYIDINVITPLLPLPNDPCYYHLNDPPLWVDLFYLDNSGHIDSLGGRLHIPILLFVSVHFGLFLGIKTDKWFLMRKKIKNNSP